jgi:lipoprotein-releasing system ATP-binding protein
LIDCLLEWLAGSRTALVIATHDPAVAERMTDVWRMDHGRLLPPIVGGER